MSTGKTEAEEAAYLAGRQDAQLLCNLYFAGTNVQSPILCGNTPLKPAEWIERYGFEHDRYVPLPDNCIAVFRSGNVTCYTPIHNDD